MTKKTKLIIGVGAVALGAYFLFNKKKGFVNAIGGKYMALPCDKNDGAGGSNDTCCKAKSCNGGKCQCCRGGEASGTKGFGCPNAAPTPASRLSNKLGAY